MTTERIDLPALLRSVQRRASMVRLADGSVARLTTEARLRLELLLRAAKTVDDIDTTRLEWIFGLFPAMKKLKLHW